MAPSDFATIAVTKSCRNLADYWTGLRAERRLPLRSEIDPAAIIRLLPYVYLIEMQDAGSVLVRLAGTALRPLYGVEMTGRDMIMHAPPEHRPIRLWRYRQAAHQPCAMYYVRRQTYESGAPDEVETLFLPLAADDATDETPAWQFIGIAASLSGRRWVADPAEAPLAKPHLFRFLDIGFGIPPTIVPADGPAPGSP